MKVPAATSSESSRSAPSICSSSSSASRPARCSTRAWAREPARSKGASTQSKWVDLDSAAIAGDGPPPKRPPQSRVCDPGGWLLTCRRPLPGRPAVRGRPAGVRSASARSRSASAGPAVGVAGDDQQSVVPRDGAEDVGEADLVQRRGEELRRARRGAQHGQVGAALGAGEQVGQQPGEPGGRGLRGAQRGVLRRQHVGRRGAVGAAHLDRAELVQVPGQRRLGDLDAGAGQQRGQVRLRGHRLRLDELADAGLARAAARRGHRRCRHERSSSQTSRAFCACRRFSASSQTALCGPSITSAAISLPR